MGITIDANNNERDIGVKWRAFLIIHYCVISLFFIRFYQHEIDADGISYISLAQKYLAGNFSEAISGHWAPLISWSIVPFLFFDIEPILAFRIVSLFIGLVCLAGIDILLREIEAVKHTRIIYLLSLSLVIAWCAENDIGADLLCACVLIYYLYFLIKINYRFNKSFGLICGLLGAIAYLAKNYNFYFFILHYSCINFCFWLFASDKQQKRTIAFNFIVGMFVFSLISGVWIAFISSKYNELTVGTAGSYNISYVRPGSPGHPVLTDGFLNPPNATAVSVWEDPTYLKLTPWNPFKSREDLRFYLKLVLKNITKYLSGFATNYIFDLTVLFIIYMLIYKRNQIDSKIYYIISTILLYPIGYFALYYDGQRYVLINAFLLYILSAYLLNAIFIRKNDNVASVACVFLIVYTSIFCLTSYRVYRDFKNHVSNLNSVYCISTEIMTYYDMRNKNIASQNGDWNLTHDMTYFLKARYFGRAKDNISDNDLRKELLDRHIDYYIVYGKFNHNIDILKPERQFGMEPYDLTIYSIQPKT